MSKTWKILPAIKVSFCPYGHTTHTSLGQWQCRPSTVLRILLTIMHKKCLEFLSGRKKPQSSAVSAPTTQQETNYHKLCGQKHNEDSQILTCHLEGINTCIYRITCNLTCSPQHTKWFEQLPHNWPPIIPKFDMDLVFSPRKSQSPEFSNSMPSPTTHATSDWISQLAIHH